MSAKIPAFSAILGLWRQYHFMAVQQENHRQEIQQIINQVRDHIKSIIPQSQIALVDIFAQRFLESCALNDLLDHSIEELAGALISQWNVIYQRNPGETKVKVYNPTLEHDGWQSTHTIIQISHDDVPFLVDSIRMEINRVQIQIHFTIHFGGTKVKRNNDGYITEILPIVMTYPDALCKKKL
jgi:glutamate dehydrogenase